MRLLLALGMCGLLAAQVKLPPYTREVLPNGTVLYFMHRGGIPLVRFLVVVKGGSEADPAGRSGLAAITAELLRRGTAQYSAAQFSEEVDGLGGTLFANASEQATTVSAEFLSKDFDRGLALVSQAILHPSFPEDEVRKTVARRVDSLKSAKDNPGAAIRSFYDTFFFGANHPYGRVPDEASYDHIQRAQIVESHQRLFVGKNLIVIVAGDFDPAAAKASVVKTFGSVPAGEAFSYLAAAAVPRPSAPRVLLIDKPDATQTYFVIAQPGVRRSTPDRVPLILVNTLFGGRFTSMINDALRVNSGLTYGASSSVQMGRLDGAITINSYTKTDTTEKAIDMALDVLKSFGEKGMTAEQLASVKAYVKGEYPTATVQTADQIAGVLSEMELYGLGRDEVDEYFARIDAVTLEQVNAVARKYFRADDLTFVLLGNAAKIRDVARKYGTVTEKLARLPGWAPVTSQ
ncbi:MAG TPA: pitrilysin family protein [Bryobacteraceae bacterium]|jgi:predicted Zn-dependent peptidase|nr:pitrilysin family protein [Bryobacteraceae bacterium]